MIRPLARSELDLALLPAITAGLLRAHYNAGNGSTEYRADGRLLAVSVGARHFIEVSLS